jgi:hypothetical protein
MLQKRKILYFYFWRVVWYNKMEEEIKERTAAGNKALYTKKKR